MFYKTKGFTLIEMLAVLLILGILVAIAAPMYLVHVNRARASEAVAAMALIRQAERDNFMRRNSYLTVASGNLSNDPEATPAGLDIDIGTAQYFSSAAYSVSVPPVPVSGQFSNPPAVDFVIYVTGAIGTNVKCSGNETNCAIRADDVKDYRMEMDNSGRVFVSYDAGANWRVW